MQAAGVKHFQFEAAVIELPCEVMHTLEGSHEVEREWLEGCLSLGKGEFCPE